jgi:hypothetical protein
VLSDFIFGAKKFDIIFLKLLIFDYRRKIAFFGFEKKQIATKMANLATPLSLGHLESFGLNDSSLNSLNYSIGREITSSNVNLFFIG